MNLEVYHYSRLKDFRLFPIEIKNSIENWCKPNGGLWCSPVGCSFGWEDCDAGEQFIQEEMTKIELKLEGEFLIIDVYEDMDLLPWNRYCEESSIEFIDFEKLVKDSVDAIYMTQDGERQTRIPYGLGGYGTMCGKFRNLYGWDCETVLILNDKCVKGWKKVDYNISKDLLERRRKRKEERMDNISKVLEELLKGD